MRKRFSERYGFVKVRDTFQIESMNKALKNRLWNQFRMYFIDTLESKNHTYPKVIKFENDYLFFKRIYDEFFKSSEVPERGIKKLSLSIKDLFFNLEWFLVYDFIEYISNLHSSEDYSSHFKKAVNLVLETEMSAYRFVDNYIAPIIDEVEIQTVEEALECKYNAVKRHLSNALELLSDRENPDYQNSMKESISAVESVAQLITGKESTSFPKLIKQMNLNFDTNFGNSMRLLYDWTSKDDGIRHANTKDELKTSFEEAKYMFVSCSAFVNYLIAKNKD